MSATHPDGEPPHEPGRSDGPVRRTFEKALWSTRYLVGIGVVGCVVTAAVLTWLTTLDVIALVGDAATTDGGEDDTIIADIVKVLDGYIVVAILLLVAFGLYELFIDKLDRAHRPAGTSPRVLVGASLDALKDKVAKLVILVLVIEFLQRALRVGIDSAIGLLYLGAGTALVSLALLIVAAVDRFRR